LRQRKHRLWGTGIPSFFACSPTHQQVRSIVCQHQNQQTISMLCYIFPILFLYFRPFSIRSASQSSNEILAIHPNAVLVGSCRLSALWAQSMPTSKSIAGPIPCSPFKKSILFLHLALKEMKPPGIKKGNFLPVKIRRNSF
jgi:hypothetical protein